MPRHLRSTSSLSSALLLVGALTGTLLFLGLGAAAGARQAPPAPIVYSAGLACPDERQGCEAEQYNSSLYTIARAGLPSKRVTAGRDSGKNPAWSPDHRRIAFIRGDNPTAVRQIWVINADGSGQRQVTRAGSVSDGPFWSPDGRKILFQGFYGNNGAEIYTVNANGTGLKRLTYSPYHVNSDNPVWSPDGRKIAFVRSALDDAVGGGGIGIEVVGSRGTGRKTLIAYGGGSLTFPAWAPNGRRIAFLRDGELTTINADGTGKRKVTSGSGVGPPVWSPDGTRIARMAWKGAGTRLVVIKASGAGRRESGAGAGPSVVWSPDGSRIAFIAQNQVTLINPDGSGIKQITPKKKGFQIGSVDW